MAGRLKCWLLLGVLAAAPTWAQERTPVAVQSVGQAAGAEAPFPIRFAASDDRAARSSQPSLGAEAPLTLSRPDPSHQTGPPTVSSRSGASLVTSVVGSLAAVLATFFAVVWAAKRSRPGGLSPLPREVVESLGRAPLLGRQQMQLIRVGRKLVLLNVTPHGAEALVEISDPAEVDRLAGLCQQAREGSISESFRQILSQHGETPTTSARSR